MASAKTISYLARNDLILVRTVQLKPTIKVQISGRMASIGISDVVTASVYSEKTRMKKLMKTIIIIIGERAKRARHSQVCSIENRGYIYYHNILYIYSTCNFVLITRKEGGA